MIPVKREESTALHIQEEENADTEATTDNVNAIDKRFDDGPHLQTRFNNPSHPFCWGCNFFDAWAAVDKFCTEYGDTRKYIDVHGEDAPFSWEKN